MKKETLLNRLKDLRRDETEEKPKASLFEAIDTLIISCEYLLNNQPERSKREDFFGMRATVDANGILTMENGNKFDLNNPIEDAVL